VIRSLEKKGRWAGDQFVVDFGKKWETFAQKQSKIVENHQGRKPCLSL
jgi:hypothetical protein